MPAGRPEQTFGLEDFFEEGGLVHFVVMMMLDVVPDDELINPNDWDKIASGPERVAFVEPVYSLNLLLEPSWGFPFDHLHNVGNWITWGSEDTEVYMVSLNIQLNHFPVFPFADGFNGSFSVLTSLYLKQVLCLGTSVSTRCGTLGCKSNVTECESYTCG